MNMIQNIKKRTLLTFVMPLALLICGPADAKGKTSAAKEAVNETAQSIEQTLDLRNQVIRKGNLHAGSVTFSEGSALLSDEAQEKLREVYNSAMAAGKIDDIQVSVWSDSNLPNSSKIELSKNEKELATRRGNEIKKFLEETVKTPSVQTFSMAEHANWIARLFNTDSAELKSSLARRSDKTSEAKFYFLRDGGPSTAMIVIESNKRN